MKPQRITFLLPGHGWEELAGVRDRETAQALCAGFTALWHPEVVAAIGTGPRLQPVYELDRRLSHELVMIPSLAEEAAGRLELESGDNLVLAPGPADSRRTIVGDLLSALELPTAGVDHPWAAQFWALGYAYLQIKLLTYRVHYSSGLDENGFSQLVHAAAEAAVGGEEDACQQALQSAHRMLRVEKRNYYPVDSFLLDLVLCADTAPIAADNLNATPASWLMTGKALATRITPHPHLAENMRAGVTAGTLCVVGGEWDEPPLFLMSCESALHSLRCGHEIFREQLGEVPTIFARRRFGLTPLMAQTVSSLGYRGLIQTTLDGARCPTAAQPRARWTLPDGQSIEALGKFPLHADDPVTMLNLGTSMGASMELDHLATVALARWAHEPPIESCADWQRSTREGSSLGRLATLTEYFDAECHQVLQDSFDAAEMVSPYLPTVCGQPSAGPISDWVRLHAAETALEQASLLEAMRAAVGTRGDASGRIDRERRQLVSTQPDVTQLEATAVRTREEAARALTEALASDAEAAAGWLLVNPCGFDRAVYLESSESWAPPAAAEAWQVDAKGTEGVVRVPGCGFVYLTPSSPPRETAPGPGTMIGEDNVMANAHLGVHLHPEQGGIRAIYDFRTRGNRASQRFSGRNSARGPSDWRCELDDWHWERNSGVRATSVASGRLWQNQTEVTRFRQRTTLVTGQRRIAIELELAPPHAPLEGSPWQHYLCSTLALPEEAKLFRSLNGQRSEVKVDRVESSHYLDWITGDRRTTLLCGGLPFHVRRERFADTLLRAGGESACQFRLGLAIDAANPLRESLDFETPALLVPTDRAPAAESGWLAHVDAVHVLITAIEPRQGVVGEAEAVEGAGGQRVRSWVVRLLETAGASGPVTLRTLFPVTAARKIRFDGTPLVDCECVDGGVRVHVRPHEWTQVELHW